MKKVITAAVLAGITALSSFGQGLVIFSSSTQNMSTNNVSGVIPTDAAASGRTAGTAGLYYYALFYSTTITSGTALSGSTGVGNPGYAFDTGGWTMVTQSYGINTAVAGRFAANNVNADGTTITVNGIGGGGTANFVTVGWSATLGNTIAALEAALSSGNYSGYLGQSVVSGTETLGNGTSIPAPALFGGVAPSMQAFTLGSVYAVPEPGTLALAALGGASLLLFRRKK